MIRKTLRAVLRHLPPLWLIATFLVCYGAVWGLEVLFRGILDALDPASKATLLQPFLVLEMGVAVFGAVAFAVWRVCALHPIVNQEYRQWLQRVPWTPDRPLPMGSVLPGLFDVVVLAVLCWMAGWPWPFSPLAPILGYLVMSTIAACVISGVTRQRAVLYGLLFALGLSIRLAGNPFLSLAVFAIAFPIVLVGLRRSIEPDRWPDYALSLRVLSEKEKPASKELGWPFAFLGPKAAPRLVRWPDTLAIALLVGWFLHAILGHFTFDLQESQALSQLVLGIAPLVALVRIVGYVVKHAAPISLFGRLLTGRWIIPGYDRVFLASLYTCVAVALAEGLVYQLNIPAVIGQPLVVALGVFLLLSVGPTYRNWQLTGSHRINPQTVCNKANPYVEV
jgi:hypothetical protein